jgi:hypothetical protein
VRAQGPVGKLERCAPSSWKRLCPTRRWRGTRQKAARLSARSLGDFCISRHDRGCLSFGLAWRRFFGCSAASWRGHVSQRARAGYERGSGSAVHVITDSAAFAARVFSRRGVLATPRAATRPRDTDFGAVGRIEDELEASVGERALSGLGRGGACLQFTRGDVRCIRARPDAEGRRLVRRASSGIGSLGDAQSPNHAMERTAGSLGFTFEMARTLFLRAMRHPARCRSS